MCDANTLKHSLHYSLQHYIQSVLQRLRIADNRKGCLYETQTYCYSINNNKHICVFFLKTLTYDLGNYIYTYEAHTMFVCG